MKLRSIILVGIALLAFTSCQELFKHDRTGQAITFSASSPKDAWTKTSYSGVVDETGRERINWVEGDPVKIFMYTYGGNSQDEIINRNYHVVNISPNGSKSEGKVAAANGKLVWQEGKTHDFFSIYPASFLGYKSDYDQTWYWGQNGTLYFTLPSSQSGDLETNMKYAYMAAVSKGYTATQAGSVILDYYPMVTTLYFTLRNNTDAPIVLKGLSVNSTKPYNPEPLSGTYFATIQGDKYVADGSNNPQSTSSRISLSFNSKELQPGENLTCAAFLLPRRYNASELSVSVTTGNGISTLSLANNNENASTFDPCLKYNLEFDLQESGISFSDVSQIASVLLKLSDSQLAQNMEYLSWKQPPGLYYTQYEPPMPVPDADIQQALAQVTHIDNSGNSSLNWLLTQLTPADFAIFPNLTSVNLIKLGNDQSVAIGSLDDLSSIDYSGNSSTVIIRDCSFDADETGSLTIKSRRTLDDIIISNVTGLKEIYLYAGDLENGVGGGNIGNVTIENCPDLKVIKILPDNPEGHVALTNAVFKNLSVETIYIEQANRTRLLEVSDCPALKRLIVCKQTDWKLDDIQLTSCAVLGDSTPDGSEYGVTGFNIEQVSLTISAKKVNCPNLGDTFRALQSEPGTGIPATIAFK